MSKTTHYTRRTVGPLAAAALLLFAHDASAQDTTLEVTVQGKKFQPSELRAPANKPIMLRIKNRDAASMEFESKSLRVEKVVAANSEGVINVRPLKPGRYEFYDDFNEKARGALTVQ